MAGLAATVCSTKSCAPVRPTRRSAARDDARRACTTRRIASSTIPVSADPVVDVLVPIYTLYFRVGAGVQGSEFDVQWFGAQSIRTNVRQGGEEKRSCSLVLLLLEWGDARPRAAAA